MGLSIHGAVWMNSENVLSEDTKHKRSHIILFHLYDVSSIGASKEKTDSWLPESGSKGKWGLTANEFWSSLEGGENILKLDSEDG